MTEIPGATGPRHGFWRRRLLDPLVQQLTQGTTPSKLALALAVGVVICVNPFLGTTTGACLAAGALLRLNQPILQIANVLTAPLQLLLIVPWVRIGERLYGAPPIPINPTVLLQQFRAGPGPFLQRFGLAGVHAATAWILAAPFLGAALYFSLRPLLTALGQRVAAVRAYSSSPSK